MTYDEAEEVQVGDLLRYDNTNSRLSALETKSIMVVDFIGDSFFECLKIKQDGGMVIVNIHHLNLQQYEI